MTEWPQQNIKVIHSNFAPTVKGWKEVDIEIDSEGMECDISCSMGHELIHDILNKNSLFVAMPLCVIFPYVAITLLLLSSTQLFSDFWL